MTAENRYQTIEITYRAIDNRYSIKQSRADTQFIDMISLKVFSLHTTISTVK